MGRRLEFCSSAKRALEGRDHGLLPQASVPWRAQHGARAAHQTARHEWIALAILLALAGCAEEPDPPTEAGFAPVGMADAGADAGASTPQTGGPSVDAGKSDGAIAVSNLDGSASGPQDSAIMTAERDASLTQGGVDADAVPPGRPGEAGTDGGHATVDAMVDAGGPRRPTFHVFLLLGQSNMAGYPKARATDAAENPRIRVLGYDDCTATGRRKDVWDTAAPPLHECWNSAIGPGDYFAKTLLEKLPPGDTIGLIPCAISGEKIETFMKVGGAKYSWIVARAKLALKEAGSIEGVLFHQGESNCGDGAWPGKVKTLIGDLKADLGLGAIPFLPGELVPTGACSRHNALVNQLPGMIGNTHVVSAQGLILDPADTQWRLHFDHDSQVTFGKRYAQAMIEALQL